MRPVLEKANAPNPAAAIPEIKLRLSALIEVAPALLQDRHLRPDRRRSELFGIMLLIRSQPQAFVELSHSSVESYSQPASNEKPCPTGCEGVATG